MVIRRYTYNFKDDDQLIFAELSGDFNPIHLDKSILRYYNYENLVVHGVHTILSFMDQCCHDVGSNKQIQSCNIDFLKPLFAGQTAKAKADFGENGKLNIAIDNSNAERLIEASVQFEDKKSYSSDNEIVCNILKLSKANENDLSAMSDIVGRISMSWEQELVKKLFPSLIISLPLYQISALLSISKLVGMHCPGRNSILSKISIEYYDGHNKDQTIKYHVKRVDKRFSKIDIMVVNPRFNANVVAFERPKPVRQELFADVKAKIPNSAFVGQKALIVGGSRGLGEVCAKIISAGGGETFITYNKGKNDASNIRNDIISNDCKCDVLHLNVLDTLEEIESAVKSIEAITHLYYFATPSIFVGKHNGFSNDIFQSFCAYYIEGLLKLINAFTISGRENLKIFVPSSVAIDEGTIGLGEYIAAKSAVEQLCQYLNRNQSQLQFYYARLPRILTDQTKTLIPTKSQNAFNVLYKIFIKLFPNNFTATRIDEMS